MSDNLSMLSDADRRLLDAAIEQAEKSAREGGVPIGAALATPDGRIVAAGHNLRVQDGDTTAHGETACMRNAGRRRDWHQLTMATTLSPCIMCTGALLLHRIPRLIVGERETFPGEQEMLTSRGVEVINVDDPRCRALMERFEREHPELWNEDIGVPED